MRPKPQRPVRPAPPVRERPHALAPALWRDPWALAVALAVLPVWFAARSTALGEPFADDFWFLQFSVMRHNPSWWDGGGCIVYWRPLARQAYFALLGPLMCARPLLVALLHALALAASGVLVYRAMRPTWPAALAAAAGAFALWMEATRILITWPSDAQDLGALFGLALTLYACARGRTALAVAGALVAALCKEVAAPLALLAAFAPFERERRGTVRRRWALAAAMAAWAVARVIAQRVGLGGGGMLPPNDYAATISLPFRVLSGFAQVTLDAFSLGMLTSPVAWAPVVLVVAAAVVVFGIARARTSRTWAWVGWGLAWYLVGFAPLGLFWPEWSTFRSVIPALGLGVALLAPFASAEGRPWWIALVAIRLVALLVAPGAAPVTTSEPPTVTLIMDFQHLSRLQRFMHEARTLLQGAYPRLAPGSVVVRSQMPHGLAYAFGEDRALQAWYGDSTLRFVPFSDFRAHPQAPAVVALEFEPGHAHELALVPIAAARMTEDAFVALRQHRLADALAGYARADSAAPDSLLYLFHAQNAGGRAFALAMLGRRDEALTEANAALALDSHDVNARLVLADQAMATGRPDAARALLESVLGDVPGEPSATRMLGVLRQALPGAPGRATP